MLQRLANMNANKPFLTQRNTEALAHDQTFPHLDANIAVTAAVKCTALRAGQFGKKPCLVRVEGVAALPLAALCAATRLPDRCRHVCKTCASMLMTQTVGGCARESAVGKVHGDSGDAKLPKCRHFWTRWSTRSPQHCNVSGSRHRCKFRQACCTDLSPATSDSSTNAFLG